MRLDWKKFARDVRFTMQQGFIGVRELGRETGIDKATISRARTGKTLSAKSFMWVCTEFDLDPWSYVIRKRVRA
jgi:transcriptional regulator with XRE-family HTH domain